MRKILLTLLTAAAACSAGAESVDWTKIRYWAGTGDNKSALVVQFADNPEAYVWGFRWEQGAEPSGEDMIRAVAAASPDLDVLVQYTGSMGATVDGVGYSYDHCLMDYLYYDFGSAMGDSRINFGFITPNTGMGQTSAPGSDADRLCRQAIESARDTHVIEHPLNARTYGYPAYDYDHWTTTIDNNDEMMWHAGWYDGYWSYWVGAGDTDRLGYSGLGMSSVKLSDGDVHGWKYQTLDGTSTRQVSAMYVDGTTGATPEWGSLNYDHFYTGPTDAAGSIMIDNTVKDIAVYNLSGMRLGVRSRDELDNLPPGIYIVRIGDKTIKLTTY